MPVIDAELEGRISTATAVGPAAELTVVGVRVRVPAGTPIKTPSKSIGVAELVDPAPLPGRGEPGFVGGTAIVEGGYDTVANVLTATAVEVEPAENLLSGALTAADPPAVNGVPVVPLPATEPRMPGTDVVNEFGFPVVLNDKVLDTLATAEGYYDGARFRAHLLEVGGGADLVSQLPQVSITRARIRERDPGNQRGDGFEIRGAVTLMHAPNVTQQQVDVFRVDNGVPSRLGSAVAVRSAEFPSFAEWRLDGETPLTLDPVLSRSPVRVRAVNVSPGADQATVDADAEVRA